MSDYDGDLDDKKLIHETEEFIKENGSLNDELISLIREING